MDPVYVEQIALESPNPPAWRGLKNLAFGSVRYWVSRLQRPQTLTLSMQGCRHGSQGVRTSVRLVQGPAAVTGYGQNCPVQRTHRLPHPDVAKGGLERAVPGELRMHFEVFCAPEYRVLSKGLPAPIVGAMAKHSSLFLTYNEFQNIIRRWNNTPASTQLPLGQLMVAAAGAGAIASFLL